MSPEAHHASAFAQAILDPKSDVPAGIARANGADPLEAFNVYRNNVVVSLGEALKSAFPVTSHLLGEGLQVALMGDFVRQSPPKSAVLSAYGDAFPTFLAAHPATKGKPFLADIAALERARTQAYHAADEDVLDGAALAAIDPEALTLGVLKVHPALRLVHSRFPIASIYAIESAALAGEDTAAARANVDLRAGQTVLVTRPVYSVDHQVVDAGTAAFINASASQAAFGAALEAGFDADPTFDPQAALTLCLSAGVFSSFDPDTH